VDKRSCTVQNQVHPHHGAPHPHHGAPHEWPRNCRRPTQTEAWYDGTSGQPRPGTLSAHHAVGNLARRPRRYDWFYACFVASASTG
jgi:hypothetical protein